MSEPEVQLIEVLRSLGATEDELATLPTERTFGVLALELVLRQAPPVPIAEAAATAGITGDDLDRLWRNLGLPSRGGEPTVPADLAAALPVMTAAAGDWLGPDVALGIARVVGSTTARLAEALVDAYRVRVEVPRLQSGESYADVVRRQIELSQLGIHGFEALVTAVFRAHLVRVAATTWAPDAEHGATRRDLFVGFIDLVGYTALARTMNLGELARLLAHFEDTVSDVIAAGGGRLVKLIGDSAMFTAESTAAGCAIAAEAGRRIGESDALPPARVGADVGTVLTLLGDYFGDVVNRAARLVAVARPGTVVVSEAVADTAPPSYVLDRLPPRALKGFLAPAVSYRLRSPS